MAVLPIVTGDDQTILRTQTEKVPKVTKEILKLLRDMEDTVVQAKGAGIAGPQVGRSLRLCIALINEKYTPLINPDIVWKSEEEDTMEEGCLSLPGIWLPVTRPVSITVHYLNAKGKKQERKLEGMEARIVQHEVDHLEGVLIVDYQTAPLA